MSRAQLDNPLLAKLIGAVNLADGDGDLIASLTANRRKLTRGADLLHEGDAPREFFVLISGFLARYKLSADGCRSVLALMVPGDSAIFFINTLDRLDHSIGALSDCVIASASLEKVVGLVDDHPKLRKAFQWSCLVDLSISRQWVFLSRHEGCERLAHFLCETFVRLDAVGLTTRNSFQLPFSQSDLGEVIGFSTVHINRCVQTLRRRNLIRYNHHTVTILDPEGLKKLAGFSNAYLHLRSPAALHSARPSESIRERKRVLADTASQL